MNHRITIRRTLLRMLEVYRYWLSPAVHALSRTGCKFEPTCSCYATEAIELHGPGQGTWLALRRLVRCHPFSRGGFDPVPYPADSKGTSATHHPERKAGNAEMKLHDPLP
jgi:putative membrane protein insertion efficiency factor